MTEPKSWFRQASLLTEGEWKHGWSTNDGPDFRGDPTTADHGGSVEILVQAAGLKSGAWAHQVHGGTVLKVKDAGFAGEADALWTDKPGLGVIGRGADCPLILVGGTRADGSHVWGFAHASWRSTVQGITAGLVLALTDAGAEPANMKAVICPSAGPCCYEVGDEVRREAEESLGPGAAWFFMDRFSKVSFDLWAANTAQMTAGGITEANIHNVQHCTICGDGTYPSFRREGDLAGRFAAVIGF